MLGRAGLLVEGGAEVVPGADPRRELLRRLARGEPLRAILTYLVAAIEARTQGLTASVLLLEQGRLRYGSAPGLPEGYNRAADNHPIGEGFGSCGTAAFRRRLVVVEDVQVDPLWQNYREITRRYGIGACWSMPILDAAGEVMGTFALYYHQARRPRMDELTLVEEFAEMAGVVLRQNRQAQALAERERKFGELVADIDGVVWESPADRERFEHVSAEAERLFGHALSRWSEPGFWQSILHPEDRAATLRRQQEAPPADRYQLEYRLMKPDGVAVWVRDTVRVQRDPEGRPCRLRGVMVDISRQREAEEAQTALEQRLTENAAPVVAPAARVVAPASPAIHTSEARLRVLADAATALGSSLDVGQLAHEVATVSVRELADACLVFTRDEGGQLACAALAHRDPTNPVTREDFARLLNQPGGIPFDLGKLFDGAGEAFTALDTNGFAPGAIRPELMRLVRRMGMVSSLALPLRVQERTLGALVFLSVSSDGPTTVQRQTAAMLARRAAVALENARLYHDAQVAVAQREEFLSVAAHELKTPLATLQLTLQAMALNLESQGATELDFLRGRLRAGERQAGRLGRLIHDLLDVSVIHAGRLRLEREPTDLAAVVAAVVARMKEDFARKQVDVTLHLGKSVVGDWDPRRLDQVITNLLSNAFKYGEERPVHVTVDGDDSIASLQIDDAGMGMSSDLVERIFKPFERGVSAGHYGGLGLGLYITSQIVRAHDGTIVVRSAPGAGSSFRVELPRNPHS